RLALERVADRGEGREADGARAVVLQHREVHEAHAHELCKPRQRHPALLEQLVEAAVDATFFFGFGRGHQTSPSASRRRRSPTANTVPTRAAMNAPSTKGKRSIDMMTLEKVESDTCAKAAFAPMFSKNRTAAKPTSP